MALLPTLALVEEGGFNLLDPNGAGNFVWTLLIFLLALPLMWKFVFGPISAALFDRDARAAAAIEEAKRASDEAEKARAAKEIALGEAQAEAAKILAEARKRAEARESDIVKEAKRKAESELSAAMSQIEAEREKAIAAIRNEVVDLSLTAASRVLGRNVSGEDDRRLASEAVAGSGSTQGS